MDNRLKLTGGEIGISSDELNLMPESNREGVQAINNGIGDGVDFIVSGVGAVISAGVNVTLQDGYIFLDGETLKVDAQVVLRTTGTDLYQFLKVTTNPTEGSRSFRDGSTKNVYEKNRAIAVNVAVITGLSVDGDTMQDVLKTAIQVQSDWNQATSSEPDFIKNKPAIVTFLMRGGFVFGDIDGSPTGALSVSGGITSATKSNGGSFSTVIFNFANVGTSSYDVIFNTLYKGNSGSVLQPLIISQNATSVTFRIGENTGNTQNIDFNISLIN